jgi:hypothetical protein
VVEAIHPRRCLRFQSLSTRELIRLDQWDHSLQKGREAVRNQTNTNNAKKQNKIFENKKNKKEKHLQGGL